MALTKQEKETSIIYNQSDEPVLISTYDPKMIRRMADFEKKNPALCRRIDDRKHSDYAEYEVKKGRMAFRFIAEMSDERRKAASEKAKANGLGRREE